MNRIILKLNLWLVDLTYQFFDDAITPKIGYLKTSVFITLFSQIFLRAIDGQRKVTFVKLVQLYYINLHQELKTGHGI